MYYHTDYGAPGWKTAASCRFRSPGFVTGDLIVAVGYPPCPETVPLPRETLSIGEGISLALPRPRSASTSFAIEVKGRLVDCDRSTVNSVRVFENGGLRDTRTVRVPMNCRPSLAAGALEYRHVNLNSFLVRSLCRQTYLSGSSVSASSGIFYGNGGSITAILPFSIRGSVFGGDRLLRDSTRVEA